MLLFQQMMVLFFLMGIGYICCKKAVFTDEVSRKLSVLVINVANPALILSGAMEESRVRGGELLQVLLIAVFMYLALLLLAHILPGLLKAEEKSRGTYRVMTVFSNIGFMGFPVITALYGKGALLYAALFMIPYNILIYTYGIRTMGKGGAKGGEKKGSLKGIFNSGVLACLVAMALYAFQISLPVWISDTITHLANLTAPLSMMVIGASLAEMDLKSLFTDRRLLLFMALKLLIIPAAGLFIIGQFVKNEVILGVCMVMLATPVGSMTAMMARQYQGDYEMAAKGVALSTLLSVATIPMVSMLL